MAIQFHPLPVEVFPEAARPYITRLNQELREMFALEGVLRNPVSTRRSDSSIARRSTVQVDVSRVTPDITGVVSGSSTVVGVPALVLGTANAAGTTTTAIATNSSIALFGTAIPLGLTGSGAVGTSAVAARGDHRHPLTDTLQANGSTASLILSDSGNDQTLTGNRGALILSTVGDVNVPIALAVAYGSSMMSTFGVTSSNPLAPVDATDRLTSYIGVTTGACRAVAGVAEWLGAVNSSATKVMGFNAFAYHGGTASVTTTTFGGGLMGGRMAVRFSRPLGTGGVSYASALTVGLQYIAPGAACIVTEGVGLNVEGNLLTGLTFGTRYSGVRIGSPTAVGPLPEHNGILIDSLLVGTNRRAIKVANTTELTAGDILTAAGKGHIFKDTQGTPEYWRFFLDSTGTKDATISIDANGLVSGTRAASATGSVTLNAVDTGAVAPVA